MFKFMLFITKYTVYIIYIYKIEKILLFVYLKVLYTYLL
jgi:hypothetical protein